MVGHLLQYHPAFLRLSELVARGRARAAAIHLLQPPQPREVRREENVLWSFAPHDISMILRLLGERCRERVDAAGQCYLHTAIADVTTTHLTFSERRAARTSSCRWLHPFKEQKLVVVGDGGDGGVRRRRSRGTAS